LTVGEWTLCARTGRLADVSLPRRLRNGARILHAGRFGYAPIVGRGAGATPRCPPPPGREMAASARLVGMILIGAGLFLGVVIPLWLIVSREEGTLEGSGAVFGLALFYGVLVIPLLGGGLYFFRRGQAEATELGRVQEQRKLLGIISTRGQVSIADLVLELKSTRERVQNDIYDLVNRGLFSGYVDWSKGVLYSVEASKLQGSRTCPNCGGELELAGKGLVKCPYCGAEIFLQG
jgi:hypothetical protein